MKPIGLQAAQNSAALCDYRFYHSFCLSSRITQIAGIFTDPFFVSALLQSLTLHRHFYRPMLTANQTI